MKHLVFFLSLMTVGCYAQPNVNPNNTPIVVSQATLDNWSFQYRHDGRRRMTHKKVPGADWVYIVYDNRDRVVMTQDGNQRNINQWTFTRYDELNRPITTGLYNHGVPVDQAGMGLLVDAGNFSGTFEPLTITYYDNYDFVAGDKYFEYRPGRLGGQDPVAFTRVKGQVAGTWTRVLGKDKQWIRSVSYYDDHYRVIQSIADNHKMGQDIVTNVYDFVGKITDTKTESIDHRIAWGGSHSPFAFALTAIPSNTDGWVEFSCSADQTTSSTRTLGFSVNTSVSNVGFGVKQSINSQLNAVQVSESGVLKGSIINVLGGDVIRIERKGMRMYYSNNGTVFHSTILTTRPAVYAHAIVSQQNAELFNSKISTESASTSVRRRFEYDHAGRLLKTWHAIDNAPPVLLSQHEYNELGQLVDKKLHTTNGTLFHQSVDYRYNIRGWLTSMNGAELQRANSKNNDTENERKDLFGMELLYNISETGIGNRGLFNGNISAMKWSDNLAHGGMKQRAYKFDYDRMSRLTGAVRTSYDGAWHSSSALSEAGVTYDLNGNIMSLQRTDEAGTLMDDLDYDYGSDVHQSNRLRNVSDAGTADGFADVAAATDDYTYDANGNMTRDNNKNITSINYNHLNLPEKVTMSTGEYLTYIYDATGRKLAQEVYDNANALKKRSDYRGEWFFENDTLRFINHDEGRAVVDGLWTPAPQLLPDPGMTLASNFTPSGTSNVSIAAIIQSNQTYVRITSNQPTGTPGFFSAPVSVMPGRKYTLKVKGYSPNAAPVGLYVSGGGYVPVDVLWPGPQLPQGLSNEAWTEVTFAVPMTVNKIRVGANWKSAVQSGNQFYINNMELYEYNGEYGNAVFSPIGYTYEYHLKDHLGNVRTTFTTKSNKEVSRATFESENNSWEHSQFTHYSEAVKVSSPLFDHTDEANGSVNVKVRSNDFSVNTAYCQPHGSVALSIVNGRLFAAGASTGNMVYVAVPTEVCRTYRVRCDVDVAGGVALRSYAQDQSRTPFVNMSTTIIATNRTIDYTFTAYSSMTYVVFEHYLAGVRNFYLDNLLIEQISTGGMYSQRLNGSKHERIGLAKSLSVLPGDTVVATVYAKYLDPNNGNWSAGLGAFITSILANTAPLGTLVDGGLPGSTGGVGFPMSGYLDKSAEAGMAPRAYLNWLYFDRAFNLKDAGFRRMTMAAREYGQDVAHEQLRKELVINEAGYVYLYLSNDNHALGGDMVEVYFDDFEVKHVKSPVVQSQDYYPFGLSFNEFRREGAMMNRMKFQSQERVDDLGLNWDSFKWRNHQPEIGRFFNVDPLSEKYYFNSPYAFSENKVVAHVELEGLESVYVFDQSQRPQDNGTPGKTYTAKVYVVGTDGNVNGPYAGSSYPNSISNTNNSTNANTLNTGEHFYNNESGHKGGTKKGLNIVDSADNRKAPGTDPNGSEVTMTGVNVHAGASDLGNYSSRGSSGCITIKPGDVDNFFSNFDWSGAFGKTGNSSGTVTVFRGESQESTLAQHQIDIQRAANELEPEELDL